jgi:hypothetical protein
VVGVCSSAIGDVKSIVSMHSVWCIGYSIRGSTACLTTPSLHQAAVSRFTVSRLYAVSRRAPGEWAEGDKRRSSEDAA